MLESKSLQESILKHQLALLSSNSSMQTQLTNEMSSSFIPNLLNSTISNESLNNLCSYNQQQQHHHFSKLGYNSFLSHNDNILTEKMNKKRKFDECENYRNEMTLTSNFETPETNKRKKSSFLISDILDLENGRNHKDFCIRNDKEEDVEDKVSNCAHQNEKTYMDKLSIDQFQTQLHRYVSTLPVDFYRLFMSLVNQTDINHNQINSQSLMNNPILDFSIKMQNKLGPLTHSTHTSTNQGNCSNKSHKYEDISLCSSSTSSSSSLMHDEDGKFLQHEISSNKKSNSNLTQSTPSTQSILSSLELLAKNQFTDKHNFASTGTNSTKNSGASSDDPSGNRSSKKQSKFSSEAETKQNSVRKQSSENIKNESNSNSKSSSNSALPAWIFCTRYSDRPSAGPRQRKRTKKEVKQTDKHRRLSTNSKSDEDQSSPFINAIISIINEDKPASAKKSKQNNLSLSTNASSSSSNTNVASNSKLDGLKSHSSFDLEEDSRSKASEQNQAQQPTESNIASNVNDDDEESDLIDSDDENNNQDDDDDENDSLHSKRARTAFTSAQLNRLKHEFERCKYLTGEKRQYLANELNLNESQIKIWFQNKRAKIKKSSGVRNSLALQLMAQGLYNHGSNRSNELDAQ